MSTANPYRQPRPKKPIYRDSFYPAHNNGAYSSHTELRLALAEDYVWVNRELSIPLEAIQALIRTPRGGQIVFYDGVDGVERVLSFTKIRLFLYHPKSVDKFLDAVGRQLELRKPHRPGHERHASRKPKRDLDLPTCEDCPCEDSAVYVFYVYKSLGFMFLFRVWQLDEKRRKLCSSCARKHCLKSCATTGLLGPWGIPGVVYTPYYVYRNLQAMKDNRTRSADLILECVAVGILLPIIIIAALRFLFIYLESNR